MKRVCLLAALILLLVGCAPSIYVNGAPPDSHMLMFRSGNLAIFANMNRHFKQVEGNESFMDYSSLPFEEKLVLPKDTLALSITLRVANQSKQKFKIVERYEIERHNASAPNKEFNVLYEGKLSRKDLNVQIPIKDVSTGQYSIEIHDASGNIQCIVGTVHYVWKRT